MLRLFALIAFLLMPYNSFANSHITHITFYHGTGCPHCARAALVLNQFIKAHPDIEVEKREVYRDRQNAMLMLQDCKRYDITSCNGVPLLITDTGLYATGDIPIITLLSNIDTL